MSRKGVVGPVRLNPQNAAIAAAIIEERTEGVDLDDTPFAFLPAFGRKLRNAVRRRRKNAAQIVLWTIERSEAECGYRYLMAFSHEDVPETFLTYEQMDAVHDIALDLAMALFPSQGGKGLDRADIDRRLSAWDHPLTSEIVAPNDRWVRRLKRRAARDDEFWRTAQRAPLTSFLLALMTPRKNTEN